jgi:hypothetical protein
MLSFGPGGVFCEVLLVRLNVALAVPYETSEKSACSGRKVVLLNESVLNCFLGRLRYA